MRQIYLLSTEHLEDGLWFRDEEDFRVGMNYVAIEAARQPAVAVLSFILMSNHVHFVLKGTRETVVAFVTQLKHRYSIYYRLKYGVKEFLRRNGLDVKQIPYDDEMRERTMAYVIMNCVAANICVHPSQYPWGTGTTFFNPAKPSGKCLGDMSGRARKAMLHSVDCDLPEDWLVNESGYILPEAYVDVRFVEALFRSPQRMHYFLMNSSKARKRINTEDEKLPAFRDQTILQALPDLCRSLFRRILFMSCNRTSERSMPGRYGTVSVRMPIRLPVFVGSPMRMPPACWIRCDGVIDVDEVMETSQKMTGYHQKKPFLIETVQIMGRLNH